VRLCDDWLDIFISFEVLERLTRIAPRFGNMPCVFLSALTDRNSQLKGRQLGADDYVTKPIDFDVLGTIIAARLAHVARTDVWVRDVQLNDREVETLARVARGKTSAEVAQILELSKRTVDFHIDNARNKLGVSTRTEDTVKALTGRLIDLEDEATKRPNRLNSAIKDSLKVALSILGFDRTTLRVTNCADGIKSQHRKDRKSYQHRATPNIR